MIFQFSPIPEGFFGDSGLTATSANHIANLLKLHYERVENELNSLNFVTEKMQIVGSQEENIMRKAMLFDADGICNRLEEVASCKGFIAFLREAIKEKKRLTEEIEDYTTLEYQKLRTNEPRPEHPVSEEEIVARMNIGERVQYLATEARAATFGKYIHPGGVLSSARKAAFDVFQEPTKVAMAGRDTCFIHRESAVSAGEIDGIITQLQAEHRKSEAELNGLKHEIDQIRVRDAQRKMDDYRKAKDEWLRDVDAQKTEIEQARMDRRKLVEELKIVIPARYRKLYEMING
ncbi:MAG: hypothetical protein IK114_14385 [Fibrobacter sp.]|nr:hypothetical protein [Fibrobacter sp.]